MNLYLEFDYKYRYVQSGAEISGHTRVYHNQAGPGLPSLLAGRDTSVPWIIKTLSDVVIG